MLLKLKNKSYPNIKRLSHSFYILKVNCISILLFIYILFFYATVLLKFNINLCTLVTKYTVILNFNFSHTIYPQWHIMPLLEDILLRYDQKMMLKISVKPHKMVDNSCKPFTCNFTVASLDSTKFSTVIVHV